MMRLMLAIVIELSVAFFALGVMAPDRRWWHRDPSAVQVAGMDTSAKGELASGANHWLRIDIPKDFRGSANDFLTKQGLLADSGPRGETANWWCRPRACGAGSALAWTPATRPAGMFWFSPGRTPPNGFEEPTPLLPEDEGESRRF